MSAVAVPAAATAASRNGTGVGWDFDPLSRNAPFTVQLMDRFRGPALAASGRGPYVACLKS